MAGRDTASFDPLAGLLADLDTIASEAGAGLGSRREFRLEPGETRPAAILFLDVVGFTGLARQLDSENLSRLIDRTFRIFDLSVRAEGGYCDKVIGDAGLYVFAGHPNFPPACEAALASALAVRERIRRINASLAHTGMEIAVRAGVSFGQVTRSRIGGDVQQLTVMGEAVNLAQRLEASALPGTIQTVKSVLDEAGAKFVLSEPHEADLKGFGPQQVYLLEARREGPRLRSGLGRLSPLIGREDLLEAGVQQLRDWWAAENTIQGGAASRLLVLQGRTAIGKSRLALEILRQLRQDGASPLSIASATAHCTEQSGLLEFCAELCQVAGIRAEGLSARWVALSSMAAEAWGAERSADLAAHLPILGYLLQSDEVDSTAIRQVDSNAFAQSCRQALKACIELAALENGGHVALIVEDLQWLGGQREHLAWLLANARPGLPLCVIGTARPAFDTARDSLLELLGAPAAVATPVVAAVAESPQPAELAEPALPCRLLELEALSEEQGDRLLQALLPGLELPQSLHQELHEKSLGLPYYYEEVARMLLMQGAVIEENGRYRAAREIAGLEMPADFRMLILGRLDLLRPELRELARHASVLGRSFKAEMLQRLEAKLDGGEADGAGMVQAAPGLGHEAQRELAADPQIEAMLAELAAERIFSRQGDGRIFFEHLLTHEAAYSSLLSSNRSQLHRAAAAILEEDLVPGTAAEWEILPELARHYESAGAYLEAHDWLCELLVILNRSTDAEHIQIMEQRALAAWTKAKSGRGSAATQSGKFVYCTAIAQLRMGEQVRSLESCQLGIDIAAANEDIRLLGRLYSVKGCGLQDLGRLQESIEAFQEAGRLSRASGDAITLCKAIGNEGIAQARRGNAEYATQLFSSALSLSKETGNLRGEIYNSLYLANALDSEYEWQAAMDLYASVAQQSEVLKEHFGIYSAYQGMANCALKLDMPEDALLLFRKMELGAAAIGYTFGVAYAALWQASALIDCGKLSKAWAEHARSFDELIATGNPMYQKMAWQSRALLQILSGDTKAAAESLELARDRLAEYNDETDRKYLDCDQALLFAALGMEIEAHDLIKRIEIEVNQGPRVDRALLRECRVTRARIKQIEAIHNPFNVAPNV